MLVVPDPSERATTASAPAYAACRSRVACSSARWKAGSALSIMSSLAVNDSRK